MTAPVRLQFCDCNGPAFTSYSDTMGNKGAFITITGDDPEPHFVSYKAVVCTMIFW